MLFRTFVLRDEPNARHLWAFLKSNWRALAGTGRPLSVTVAEHKSKRTLEQNKRYWAILNEIAELAWVNGKQYSADAWHEYFKGLFIGYEETPDGRRAGISTTTLSVAEFSDYMTRIEQHAADELGLPNT
jgi:hypothetical protein